MVIDVDITAGRVLVREPEVLNGFSVASTTADDGVVAAAMGDAGIAAGDAHVWVDAAWVRDAVGDSAGAGWGEQFDAMVAYAATKGWMNDAGTHIKAHIDVVAA